MPLIRSFSWMLLAAGGFALVGMPGSSQAQPGKDELPKQPSNYAEVSTYKTAPSINDLKKAKDAFTAFAKYNAEYIAHPKVYSIPQEFVPPKTGVQVQTTDQLITELKRHILVPLPDTKINADNADYIRELGLALDTELKTVIEQNGAAIAKVNATRMLAEACRSGATAHYPTITGLITDPNRAPEIKYYAFQAAANLLAAYDLNDYPSRKHSNKPKEVSELIAALQKAITDPTAILPAPAGGGPLPPDQIEVLRFIRRQAIKALGQVRFSVGQPGGAELYPAYTLAQVAVSDPAIVIPPTETEVAEAVIGLCNMAPPSRAAEKIPYAYAITDALATGICTFATRRATSPLDKTLAWRNYSSRISDALKLWRPLFDPAFSPAKPTVYLAATIPKPVDDLIANADREVLTPMLEGNGIVKVNILKEYRDNTLRADKKWTLSPYLTNPKITIPKGN